MVNRNFNLRQNINLNLKQKQKLALTPELMQSIEILSFSQEALIDFLHKESLENPLMDISRTDEVQSIEEGKELSDRKEELLQMAESFDYSSNSYTAHSDDGEDYSFLDFTSEEESLKDFLIGQLSYVNLSAELTNAVIEVIDSVNSRGYFTGDLRQMAESSGDSIKLYEKALSIVQGFEPRGVGAVDLYQCLTLQLDDENAKYMVEHHLEDIAKNRIAHIAKKMKLNEEEVVELASTIKDLDPRPGSSFSYDTNVRYIKPEAEIIEEDGKFILIIDDKQIPKVRVNNAYKLLIKKANDEETLDFLEEKLASIKWIQDSMAQRESTIKLVLEEIIRTQEGYFRNGDKDLKPMSQKDMADKLELHESTISRVANGKYVETPQGVKEIKFFFSKGQVKGDDNSPTAIKHMIKDIIDQEDKKKPLSDSKIEKLLKEKGIKVSRRTVALYRDEIGILSSTMRKVY